MAETPTTEAPPEAPHETTTTTPTKTTMATKKAAAKATAEPQAATTWYAPNQQCVHADGLGPARIIATGATAGIPGAFTPAGCELPSAPGAAMTNIVANPATPWTTGQYVQTALAGAPGRTTWTGAAWVGGVAP
jgi:hypothetical protein